MSNYAIKSNLSNKNATDVNTSGFSKKTDLTSVKLYIDKIDIKELENVPLGLNCLKSKVDKLNVDKLKPVTYYYWFSY